MTDYSQIPQFPRNLSYNMKKLSGAVIKQKLKLNSDLSTYKNGQIINFYIPPSRMIDLRSVCIYAKGKTTSGTNKGVKFARGGLHSLIEQFQITANSRILQSTSYYNYVYGLLSDLEGYGSSDQYTKRNISELYDPSITLGDKTAYNGSANNATAGSNFAVINNTQSETNDEDIYMCANNFLGLISSSSVSCLDLNNIGQLKISLTLSDIGPLWIDGNATGTPSTPYGYELSDVYMTFDTITFTNSLYFDLVKAQLETDGLNIAYQDFIVQQLNSFTRSGGAPNLATQVNASSLDMCIATFRPSNYATTSQLVLSTNGASSLTFNEVLANLPTNASTGGAFNNSRYFLRDGAGILTGSWYVNSQPFTQQATPVEIFNNTLQALSYGNLAIDGGGLHPGCYNLNRFCRQYFADILSLQNIAGDNSTYWVSGLSGGGGASINIQYNASFETTSTDASSSLDTTLLPYIISVVSKVLNVKIGRSLDLWE